MRSPSHSQAGPPKIESQLFGGPPSGLGSPQTYQLALGLSRLDRLSRNQRWVSEVWLRTRSIITRSSSSCARWISASKSASVPNIGSTSR